MFLKNFHIFIKKRAVLQQKLTVQVTTLADCDDITDLTVEDLIFFNFNEFLTEINRCLQKIKFNVFLFHAFRTGIGNIIHC